MVMYTTRKKIVWFALSTRLALLALQLLADLALPDHEPRPRVFQAAEDPAEGDGDGESAIHFLLGGLKRWDAHYFLHIAEFGYTYEQCLAFQPLYPMAVRAAGALVSKMLAFAPVPSSPPRRRDVLLASAIALNVFFFVKSALALHSLSLRVLKSESLAYRAAILYCANPASVFFSAPYSESLFAWLSFSAMLECLGPETLRFTNVPLTAAVPIALSIVTRANGILNLGFLAYAGLKGAAERTLPDVLRRYRTVRRKMVVPLLALPLAASLTSLLFAGLIAATPWLALQVYNYFKFCVPHEPGLPDFLADADRVPPGRGGAWCERTPPIAYSYVQSHYWDVGFLRYYRLRQIPNFVLAAPAISVVLGECWLFFRRNREHSRRLGISAAVFRRSASGDSADSRSVRSATTTTRPEGVSIDRDAFPFVVHALFVALFCSLFIHVQVSTRLLCSSSPVLYWFLAARMENSSSKTVDRGPMGERFRRIGPAGSADSFVVSNLEGAENMSSRWKTFLLSGRPTVSGFGWIRTYFFGYFVIGTVCFSNFYPWT